MTSPWLPKISQDMNIRNFPANIEAKVNWLQLEDGIEPTVTG